MSDGPGTAPAAEGVISRPTSLSVDQTVSRLTELLTAKGIKLFAVIDHSGEASRIGQDLRTTKLAIFGNPAAGTPVMVAAPLAALDLPLKLLIWEGEGGQTWVSYNDVSYLVKRYGLPDQQRAPLAAIDAVASALVDA
jgi:uncharacterized protein (DUF302 family)